MHNFKILRNERNYKICEHPFKLLFVGGTIIKEVQLPNVPRKVYEFKSFVGILAGNY